MKIFITLFSLCFALNSCKSQNENDSSSLVNSAHLDHLYQDISIDGKPMAIIHIYCEYPDYKWVDDADEGISCVDDVARAGIFYLRDYAVHKTESSLTKSKKLIHFVLHLQSENGYFYNFIFPDYSINKTGSTSINNPNWWSWRAGWALQEGLSALPETDSGLKDSIQISLDKLFEAVKKDIPKKFNTKIIGGFERPDWLLFESASDQTSILLLSLKPYADQKKDSVLISYSDKLAEGMRMMQVKEKNNFLDGAFLSWENSWHAWGNVQSYALLNSGFSKDVHDDALYEIDHFYKKLSDNQYWNELDLKKQNDSSSVNFKNRYDQIAYGIRPMVFSATRAYELTNDSSYAIDAAKFGMWFMGNNIARIKMYDEKTGRGFDGIRSGSVINKNSGAESTIEALLSIQAIEKNEVTKKYFNQMISESKKETSRNEKN